jgi:hypothetical protein
VSVSVSGNGQFNDDARKRCSITRTPVLPTPTRRATSRDGNPPSNVSRKISRTLRIASLSVGIGHPQMEQHATAGSAAKHPQYDRDHSGMLIAITQE